MPTTTPNLGLTKDYEGEPYSLARINANSDRIDTFAGEALTDTVYDTTGTPALIKKRKIAGVETPVTIETPDTTPTEGSKHLITSDAVHAALASKQDELTAAQLAAANSGITAERLAADEADITSVKHMVDPRSQSQVSGGNLDNVTVSEIRVYVAPLGLPSEVSASSICIAETRVVDSNSAYQVITLLTNQGTAQNRSYPTYKRVKVGGVWYDWKLVVS